MVNYTVILIAVVLFGCTKVSQSENKRQGMDIISKEIILQKAEERFIETYGDEVLKQRPFIATESESYWTVEGTFHCSEGDVCKGGTAKAVFDKFTGEQKNISHGK